MFNPIQFYEAGKPRSKPFVFTVDTTKVISGSSDSKSIKLFIYSDVGINIKIDWGDGNITLDTTGGNILHSYSVSGVYTIKIYKLSGLLMKMIVNNNNDRNKFIKILQWGCLDLTTTAFKGCSNLNLSEVTDIPKSLNDTIQEIFSGCSSITTVNKINSWNFSGVTNLNAMFLGCINFNQLLDLNTNNAIDMSSMFNGCKKITTCPTLKTSNVTTMSQMFSGCTALNSAISFNTPNVTNMREMFFACTSLNSSISMNSSNVTTMSQMFSGCTVLDSSITLDTSKVTSMDSMFNGARDFNKSLSFDVSSVLSFGGVFYNMQKFNQDLSSWNFNKNVQFANFLNRNFNGPITPSYYDAILEKIKICVVGVGRTQTIKTMNNGNQKYTIAGKPHRDALIADGWTITDAGMI